MAEIVTISREKPAVRSMDYAFLKEEGIRRLQELAGKIWTDYNEHDPGVTILEALCYAITDLGYRTSFDMKDLLSPNPIDGIEDEFDFYTARQILHNNPLTVKDYRKLLMDVSILADSTNPSGERLGVKNAWIRIATSNEHPVYVNKNQGRLQYEPTKLADDTPLDLSLLYEVVLEFTDSATYGDLNTDIHSDSIDAFHPNVVAFILGKEPDEDLPMEKYDQDLYDRLEAMSSEDLDQLRAQTAGLLDLSVVASVEFPRWDEVEVDWRDITTIKQAIKKIELTFIGLPSDLEIKYKLDQNNIILLASGRQPLKDRPVPLIHDITNRVNCLILGKVDSLLYNYQQRVLKILEIVAKAKARLHAHRNLCEDFFQFSALRVEEILICADVELDANANAVEVEAQIYFLIDQFLSPTVKFYGINELLALDQEDRKYQVVKLDKDRLVVVVGSKLKQELSAGDKITLSGFGAGNKFFTVKDLAPNELQSSHTDITVEESLTDLRKKEDAFLYVGELDEEDLRPVEDVMVGPRLDNGFIDDDELQIADLREFLHASDLINLIMDIPGVKTIRKLEMANIPQDANPDIDSRSVKWCLKLAVDQNYIPRLSTERSRITFLKDSLPIGTKQEDVYDRFEALKASVRKRIQPKPQLDFPIPEGQYRELKDFVSVQNEFPLVYGVGPEGFETNGLSQEQIKLRRAQVLQLKGFLTIFDQLLANYLAQLEHFKDLFSFNPLLKIEREGGDVLPDEYNFQVNKTYFSQPVYDIVPNGHELYSRLHDSSDLPTDKETHDNKLQELTESSDTFISRRNRFLDHLMARFAEQVTDYALLAGRIDGAKAPLELIEDKQDFLSMYPDISSNRGKAFDYKSPYYWHRDNTSGLARRVSFLNGIDPMTPDQLVFDPALIAIETSPEDTYSWTVIQGADTLLEGQLEHDSMGILNIEVEKLILCGTCRENYRFTCRKVGGQNHYSLFLGCQEQVLGALEDAFTTREDLNNAIDQLVDLFKQELLNNPLANRNNLALPIGNYFFHEINDEDIDVAERTYKVDFSLYAQPFHFETETLLMEGTLEEKSSSLDIDTLEELRAEAERRIRQLYWDIIFLGGSQTRFSVRSGHVYVTDRFGEELAGGPITEINSVLNDFNVEATTDDQAAIERLRLFFERTFFRQEGMHVVEHILLRPKVNDLWVQATPETLEGIPEQTSLIPFDEFIDVSFELYDETLRVLGDVTDKLKYNRIVTVELASETLVFQVASFTYYAPTEAYPTGYTEISRQPGVLSKEGDFSAFEKGKQGGLKSKVSRSEVKPGYRPGIWQRPSTPLESGKGIAIQQIYRVINVDEQQLQLTIKGSTTIKADDVFTVFGPHLQLSQGTFRALYVSADGDDTMLEVGEFKVQDKLLPIYTPTTGNDIEGGEDCEACKVTNPYSHIAHVVVAAWPGRFDNLEFRSFFERSLRQEAPAHVFLNICWIGADQMEQFEKSYKTWLMLNVKRYPSEPFNEEEQEFLKALSAAQNELVEVLDQLRNVYPVRTLHDCDEGDSTEGAIILNQTALGEI